jgi:hypothetical protein
MESCWLADLHSRRCTIGRLAALGQRRGIAILIHCGRNVCASHEFLLYAHRCAGCVQPAGVSMPVMPHGVSSKRDQHLKARLSQFRYSSPMRHNPVCFTDFSGSPATHHPAGRIVACFLYKRRVALAKREVVFSSCKDGFADLPSLCRIRNVQIGTSCRHGWSIRHIPVFGIVA